MKSAWFVPVNDEALRETELDVVFEMVMVCDELAEPSFTVPKLRDAGDAVTLPEPPLAPVPESETDKFVEPLVIVHEALSGPVVLGVKIMAAVQVADAARLVPQVVD